MTEKILFDLLVNFCLGINLFFKQENEKQFFNLIQLSAKKKKQFFKPNNTYSAQKTKHKFRIKSSKWNRASKIVCRFTRRAQALDFRLGLLQISLPFLFILFGFSGELCLGAQDG